MSVVALLALDGMPAHQLSTPGLVLAAALNSSRADYELRVCAPSGTITTEAPAAMTVTAPWGLEGLADAAAVIIPGHTGFLGDPPADVSAAVREAAGRGSRVLAVGTGAFTLAATGLLDGRRATTVWQHLPQLAARHPRVEIEASGAVVVDGPFLTAAGAFGGMDLVLRLIEYDHGPLVVAATIRRLVQPLHQEARSAQAEIDRALAETAGLEPTMRWVEANAHRTLSLTEIAAHARLSVRSLNRRFWEHTGRSPLEYLLRTRLERARYLLESEDATIEQIAERTGFGSPESLRRHFHRATGTVPSAYRKAYRGRHTTPPAGIQPPGTQLPGAPRPDTQPPAPPR
ncbi:GlxA family transcriptional regulator [Streptomyces zagrosensis]|uniref:Transcriptional regulator GlxA family with amidase domain n=1 Tax=Streptomyces zagrosensis TaxID=1042984 RepID=A0A7W9Q7G6_9ACTN|nr:helix-turn-helix domain-containing protein [Streptomyces zagrosensis]MBB5935033.1 transcriptional regulator GlxA family with amidase domain [Streptomyces zagrosensis]